jgi:Uma2 family endonuclease
MSALATEVVPLKPPHKFSLDEYHLMGETGILGEDDRVELIEGEIIDMAPIGHFHSGLGNALIELLGYPARGRAVASVQNPIRLGPHSEPQPDFALLRYRPDRYKHQLPTAADVLLVVEIADKSLCYDREIKTPLYARHGIPEYWIVNLRERRVEVHQDPDQASGCYRSTRTLTEGKLTPACFPDLALDIGELLR